MGRSRSSRWKRESATSLKDLNGLVTVDTARRTGAGFTSLDAASMQPNSLNESVERFSAPLTFDVGGEPEKASIIMPGDDEYDDNIWPNSQGPMKHTQMTHHSVDPVWDSASIKICIEICKRRGFITGAIVVKRPLPGISGADWKLSSPWQWGMISTMHHYIPGQTTDKWHPLTVKWVYPHYHAGKPEEEVFPNELFLVMARPSDKDLEVSFGKQRDDAA